MSVDYTAKEDRHKGSDSAVRHFIGVFDPRTGQVEVIEAKKMLLRGTVRSQQAAEDSLAERIAAEVILVLFLIRVTMLIWNRHILQ
jgi:DNA-directed RNA polymerase I subunit RPA49